MIQPINGAEQNEQSADRDQHHARLAVARQDETPGAHRFDRRVLPRIAAGRNRHRLEEGVPGADARRLARIGRDEARAARRLGDRGKAGPAEPAAPQRRDAAVEHFCRAVARVVLVSRERVLG